jgi:hypothetical protein
MEETRGTDKMRSNGEKEGNQIYRVPENYSVFLKR